MYTRDASDAVVVTGVATCKYKHKHKHKKKKHCPAPTSAQDPRVCRSNQTRVPARTQ
jgi:hypothetical protein